MKRILYVSSTRSEWFEDPDPEAHLKAAPYSIDAIGCHLARRGWIVGWAGWPTTRSIFRLTKRIDDFRPDIIYTYGSMVALHPVWCRKFLCRYKDFKVVHGWDDHYDRIWGEMLGWPGRLFMKWFQTRIVKNSDAVVTLSHTLQRLGAKWGVDCHYIPNGADPVETLTVKGDLKLKGRFKVVYTGDKARWKRTEEVCRAMRKIPKDIKLYLTGARADYLNKYESENCIFLGWLSKEEQFNVMSQADAFVCTSNQDCNAKLQEYLRWKKPILAYDGEANLFFKNGRNALLTKDYVEPILCLANDPVLCGTLAENAARDIPVYSWAEIAEQFERYFLSLVSTGVSGEELR